MALETIQKGVSSIQFSVGLINKAVALKSDSKTGIGRVEGGRLLIICWESTAMEYVSCLREAEADFIFVIGSVDCLVDMLATIFACKEEGGVWGTFTT